MSRAFWFAVGAGTSVYAMVKTRRAAERLTPAGLHDQIGALAFGARLLREEVLVGMGERESELRQHLAVLDPGRPHQLSVTRGRERGTP
ncbi:MAG TPA: DUF6167 family protein [Nocardioidaceae bacterium]|nr:DUF6167 family protein [Nocardioidaceae bacterium]